MALSVMSKGARLRKEAAFVPVRAALGASMVFHGVGKLRDTRQAGGHFEQMDIRPGRPWAVAAGVAELAAGVSSILGILTRPAALAVLVTQAVAVAKVHAQKGYDITKGGFEYNLALMAIAAGMFIAGPGLFSTHEAAERAAQRGRLRRNGPLVRFLKLVK